MPTTGETYKAGGGAGALGARGACTALGSPLLARPLAGRLAARDERRKKGHDERALLPRRLGAHHMIKS